MPSSSTSWRPTSTRSPGRTRRTTRARAASRSPRPRARQGFITAYKHAFGLNHALGALVEGPVIAGVNWYDSFDQPTADGECQLTAGAQVRGGHEIELFGLEVEAQRVWAYQSWGPTWGGLGNGTFWFSWDTFNQLLHETGDVTTFS